MSYTLNTFWSRTLGLVLAFAITAAAVEPVGTASSPSFFTLGGATVTPNQGVPSWPVLPGYTIVAGTDNVAITFTDGSVVTLSPNAKVQIQMVNGKPVINVQSGAVHYSLKSLNSVGFTQGTHAVSVTSLTGNTQVGTAAGLSNTWWTAGHTVGVIAAAGGATALGVGLTLQTPSPQ